MLVMAVYELLPLVSRSVPAPVLLKLPPPSNAPESVASTAAEPLATWTVREPPAKEMLLVQLSVASESAALRRSVPMMLVPTVAPQFKVPGVTVRVAP